MELISLLLVSCFVVVFCGRNNSPEFLSKILYNNDFIETNSDKNGEPSDRSNKPSEEKPPSSRASKEELMSNLDESSNEELVDFDPSSIANDLINEIKS